MAERALSTQGMANTYPPWSSIRNDPQSAGQQLLNSIGLNLDDLRRQTARMGANNHLATSIVSDIDVYYKYQLPRGFEFRMSSDDTQLSFSVPNVKAYLGSTTLNISLAEDNELENFWYNAIPTRVENAESKSGTYQDYLVVRGSAQEAPFTPTNIEIPLDNHLFVTVSGADSCIQNINGTGIVGTVQINGKDSCFRDVTENVIFLHDDSYYTNYDFSTVSGVSAWGFDDPDNTKIMITAGHGSDSTLQESRYYRAAYQLANYESGEGDEMPLFWTLGYGEVNGDPNRVTLELHTYDVDDITLRMDGWTSRSAILRYDLLDSSDVPIDALDMCIEPWTSNIWVITSGMLYLYDDKLEYPNLQGLEDKDYAAEAVLEPSSLVITSGEELQIDYTWRRPSKGMRRHRAWVEKPDGTLQSLEDGAETSYHTDVSSWVVGEPKRKLIRGSEFYYPEQYGEYIYSLQTTYTDDSESIDQRVVYVAKKNPNAEFEVNNIIPSGVSAISIDTDSSGRLWITDAAYDRHRPHFHYDNMIIDAEKKIIYFRDQYDKVEVSY